MKAMAFCCALVLMLAAWASWLWRYDVQPLAPVRGEVHVVTLDRWTGAVQVETVGYVVQ
jgi:hypothetical protein